MWPFKQKQNNHELREQMLSNPIYQQLVKNQAYHAAKLAELKARLISRKSPKEAVRFLQEWEEKTKAPTLEQLLDELFPLEK